MRFVSVTFRIAGNSPDVGWLYLRSSSPGAANLMAEVDEASVLDSP
jgi:hypothetical protein